MQTKTTTMNRDLLNDLMQQDGDPGDPPDGIDEPIVDWTDSEYLIVNNFADLAARRVELKHKHDRLSREIEALNLELGALLETAEVSSVRFGQHRLTLAHATSGGRLLKEKLLEQGVTAAQLAAATSPKRRGRAYVKVNTLKGPED